MLDAMRILNKWQPMMDTDGTGGTGGAGDQGTGDKGTEGDKQAEKKKDDTSGAGEGEKKYTDADLNRIVEKKKAQWKDETEKKIDETKKLADMTAQEKAEFKLKQTEARLQEYERKEALRSMMSEASKILGEKGITVPESLLKNLVTEDAEHTKKAVDEFAKVFTDAVDSAVKEKLKGNPPKAGTGTGNGLTKKEILDIKDPAARRKAIQENIHLFVKS